jgi:hypothetical protein
MNKTIFAPLFTMLVVSCGVALPSSGASSNSSSNSTTSSTSGSSSVEPVSTRKVPFNQIGSLVAQVVDAKAMGIVNSKDRLQVSGRKNAQEKDQNYMVKVTETYNPNTEITEDQTVQVTFSRVTNTQTTELQTGTESYVATAEALEIERLTDLPGNIVITNVEGYEFRLMSGEVVVQDWIRSELETIEFVFDEALSGITLESRSLNASISFITFEGFTYTIKQGETVIYEDLEDNDEADNNEALGNITLSGLTEGLTYDVTYKGYQVIETITQDEVEGQVDKFYVLNEYTIVSFVPLSINLRPQDQDLELDYDDVPLYDKQGYFSDSTRQSFLVSNINGLIYPLINISIEYINNGLIKLTNDYRIYDLEEQSDGELNLVPIFSNPNVEVYQFRKDRYGNNFIINDKINEFVEESSTLFITDVRQFLINNENEVFLFENLAGITPIDNWYEGSSLVKIGENFSKEAYKKGDLLSTKNKTNTPLYGLFNYSVVADSNYLYVVISDSDYFVLEENGSLATLGMYFPGRSGSTEYSKFGRLGENYIWHYGNNRNLYAVSLIDIIGNDSLFLNTRQLLLSNCNYNHPNSYYSSNYIADNGEATFSIDSFNGTVFYKPIINNEGQPDVIDISTFLALDKIIVLQPINR